MNELRYTLVTDGSSDAALKPVLTWLLQDNGVTCPIQGEWADLSYYRTKKKLSLSDRITLAYMYFPCNVMFVHRDSERTSLGKRVMEIRKAEEKIKASGVVPPIVCVVPIRMLEAWLLVDEMAIRYASGNCSGTVPLDLPPLRDLERVPNPKKLLHSLLKTASNLNGRRLDAFNVEQSAFRITEFISDFSPLRELSAFAQLETEIQRLISRFHC